MSKTAAIRAQWDQLAEEERELLLPELLMTMRGWRAWSSDPQNCLYWLERIFERTGKTLLQAPQQDASSPLG